MLDHFGFREDPFGVTPDPGFLYESLAHRQAFAVIRQGISAGRGFMALIAEPGMGKTTLLFKLMEQLNESARTAFLFQTQCNSQEFLGYMLADLEIDIGDNDVVQMHLRLNQALAREAEAGRRCVVVIDEAQDLEPAVLETVRLLSNFETPRSKLLQIVLAGQPALANRLAEDRFKQLRQRLSSVSHLRPMQPSEVGRYMEHRLRVAGYRGAALFDANAEAAIAHYSDGVPRVINNLCFNALCVCQAAGRRQVTLPMVQEVLGSLELNKCFARTSMMPFMAPAPAELEVPPVEPVRASRPIAEMPRPAAVPDTVVSPKPGVAQRTSTDSREVASPSMEATPAPSAPSNELRRVLLEAASQRRRAAELRMLGLQRQADHVPGDVHALHPYKFAMGCVPCPSGEEQELPARGNGKSTDPTQHADDVKTAGEVVQVDKDKSTGT